MIVAEHAFAVRAPADRVFAYLLNVNDVVRCVPGTQLSEVVDPSTFRGRVRIRFGPVSVYYDGVARIESRDDAGCSATIVATGSEDRGTGTARVDARITVTEEGDRATVRVVAKIDVSGRIALFGGTVGDIARRLIVETGECITAQLEQEPVVAAATQAASEDSEVPSIRAGSLLASAIAHWLRRG